MAIRGFSLSSLSAFRAMLRGLGVEPVAWRAYPDHHAYTRPDVEDLDEWAAQLPQGGFVLTTQKDLVKLRLPKLGAAPVWAVRINFEIREGEAELQAMLDRAVS